MSLSDKRKASAKKPENPAQLTAQDFLNIKDIKDGVIYNKSGMAFITIAIEAVPRELLTPKEQARYAFDIISLTNEDKKPYRLIKLQGRVDMTDITNSLYSDKQRAKTDKRKILISEEMAFIDKITLDGTALTPQFYINIWDSASNVEQLKKRADNLAAAYTRAGMNAALNMKAEKLIMSNDIAYLLSLYSDPLQVNKEYIFSSAVEPVTVSVPDFGKDDYDDMYKWNK